ncbi:MAG TPA: serine/threonine-protein kinase [Candidatus Acidoferrum sp.]|nr:serine/threonine-protein kinase [Candidatus Acidoferrum sp.]
MLTSSDPIGGGRFTPGQIIAERYRIVALAGRGGMGEVYRADDLKLSQVVAIKFLPEALSRNTAALSRFHSEVRIARQVSHPNVCRVFDIGDVGVPFLSMEYVDGEDLASVVRRIGRLSPDKATEVARQICAGLAAAHERGVVHRDLKPANVMLDGAGKIRITDFGLAGIAASIQGADVRAGTPAYMAPEQLAGREVTAKSDIFSLGLILYEILTGKRAFEASTLPELMRLRESGTITNPSTLVRDLDPLIERVILRCLEKDPEKRPASALQVAAALPGGDPLAAALAAGETPSPQMVAAAGETSGLAPRVAIAYLATVVLGMSLFFFLGIRESGLERLHPENSPEVLAKKSREITSNLGYPAVPVDKVDGFAYDYDFLSYLTKKGSVATQWDRVLSDRPSLLLYWYRQSPRELSPNGFWNNSFTPSVVTFEDPPAILSGMINLELDPEGRLTYFQAIPPEMEEHPQAPRPPDWSALFAAAGLEVASLHPVDPAWNSLASSDTRAAWDGNWPGSARPLHVEAAAWRGKPVFFALSGAWTKATRMNSKEETRADKARQIIFMIITVLVLAGAVFLARRNYVRGKGDRRSALRIASVVFALEISICLFRAHFTLTLDTAGIFIFTVSTALFVSGLIWVLYLALEPYVRRNWPQTIISWSRLLAGRLRDPLVGRDLLFGTLLGMLWSLVFAIGNTFDIRAGAQPQFPNTEFLLGFRETSANWLANLVISIQSTLVFFFVLVLLRVLVRNRWLAAALFVALFSATKIIGSDYPMIETPMWLIIYSIAAVAVVRFGLIVLAVGIVMVNVLLNLPYSLDFSNWYAGRVLFVVLGYVVLAIWGFYTSLAGQRLWKDELFD